MVRHKLPYPLLINNIIYFDLLQAILKYIFEKIAKYFIKGSVFLKIIKKDLQGNELNARLIEKAVIKNRECARIICSTIAEITRKEDIGGE